jgi:hypothetical protein
VDFNRNPPRLDTPGVNRDLARYGIDLAEGRTLVVYDQDGNDRDEYDDVIAVGVAMVDKASGRWVAEILGDTYFHYSELDHETQAVYREYRPQNGDAINRNG